MAMQSDFIKSFINESYALLDLLRLKFNARLYSHNLPPDFKTIVDKIREDMSMFIDNLNKELPALIDNMEWSTLNISFFGETNAGKSTLIEALIRGDGSSIGYGAKDYTTEIREVFFTLPNYGKIKIKLIDMPGIEGKEDELISKIRQAVTKSHIVFYVIPSSKEPERETLEKVKDYLSGRAKISIVLNKRSSVEAYKINRSLMSENINTIVERVREHAYRTLGNLFTGDVIVVDANLAFLSRGKIGASNRFYGNLNKALTIFGSKEEMEKTSAINHLMKHIETFMPNVDIDIIKTNLYKFLLELESVLFTAYENKKLLDEKLKESFKEKDELIASILRKRKNLEETIRVKRDNFIKSLHSNLRRELHMAIDNQTEGDKVKSRIEDLINNLTENFTREIESEISEFEKFIEDRLKYFQRKIVLVNKTKVKAGVTNVRFNELTDRINIRISEYISTIFRNIFKNIPAFIGNFFFRNALAIVGGLVFTFVSFLLEVFSSISKIKSKRKQQVDERLSYEIENIESRLDKLLLELNTKTNVAIKNIKRDFDVLQYNIESVSRSIDNTIYMIHKRKGIIINSFLKYVIEKKFDVEVDIGYLEITRRMGIVVLKRNSKRLTRYIKGFLSLAFLKRNDKDMTKSLQEILNLDKVYVCKSRVDLVNIIRSNTLSHAETEFFRRCAIIFRDELGINILSKNAELGKLEIEAF